MRSNRHIKVLMLAAAMAITHVCVAAEVSGDWVGQLTGPFQNQYTAQYNHVALKAVGTKLSGMWGANKLVGTLTGAKVDISLTDASGKPMGTLTGTMDGDSFSGTGSVVPAARIGGGGMGAAQPPSAVTWKLSRAVTPPAKPKTYDFDPPVSYGTYSAAEPPNLHIFPGDTVNTQSKAGANAIRHGTGGDANIGPFYVEGALPGDTLVVHFIKIQTNTLIGRQGSRFNQYAVTPAYNLAAQYDANFDGGWSQYPDKGIATLPASPGLPHLTIPLKPMLGCISVAPPGEEQWGGTDLGVFGGNMDYNQWVTGATLYFPVFHPGALFGFGDAHGAMGDGEVVGTGLETSVDVTFSVDVIKGYATSQVRGEDKDYLISMGVSGSVPESIQLATSQLAEWIKHDYHLNDSEVALLFGDALKYEITELVDPHFNVAAKIPKSVLATLNK
ncbi:MAG TPA: acetamidase/formamidase family protein [Acidobacteriaceae bacterium]|jgi:acetamidase/formamidase|nr:acetamidase/formamidase family protein [Acidobacteriaceae bacterium]